MDERAGTAQHWLVPHSQPVLPPNEAHVWQIELRQPPPVIDHLAATLAPQEQERAARFFRADARERWIVGRGALRAILGGYCGIAPAQVRFGYGPQRKPVLEADHARLRFNLSHSHALALVAITYDHDIGIDVERIQPRAAMFKIAERFFSPNERAALRALPAEQQTAAFFHGWARKEAYIKARGGGFAIPLHQFDVAITPDRPAALLADRANPDAPARWTIAALPPIAGYAAAVAVEARSFRTQTWRWPIELR